MYSECIGISYVHLFVWVRDCRTWSYDKWTICLFLVLISYPKILKKSLTVRQVAWLSWGNCLQCKESPIDSSSPKLGFYPNLCPRHHAARQVLYAFADQDSADIQGGLAGEWKNDPRIPSTFGHSEQTLQLCEGHDHLIGIWGIPFLQPNQPNVWASIEGAFFP